MRSLFAVLLLVAVMVFRAMAEDPSPPANEQAMSGTAMNMNDPGKMEQAGELPAGVTLTGELDTLQAPHEAANSENFYGYRNRFYHPRFRHGYYGWRYPMPYWNYYGRRYYGGRCPYGVGYGGYYYC